MEPQLLDLVAVARDEQRPAAHVAGIAAGAVRELGRELRVQGGAGEPEAEQRLLGQERFADRRQHPGGHARGAPPRARLALQHDHAEPAPRGAPGESESDHATAHDGGVK